MKYSLLQLRWIFILLSSVLFSPVWTWGNTSVVSLKVQNVVKPLVVEDRHPVFSWQMSSDERGQKQSAYQIIVTRKSDGRVVWDSRKVESGVSTQIKYQGVALQPEMAYDWNLTVWDAQGKSYAASSSFETVMNPHISAERCGMDRVEGAEAGCDSNQLFHDFHSVQVAQRLTKRHHIGSK